MKRSILLLVSSLVALQLMGCTPSPLPIPPAIMVCAAFTAAPYVDNYKPGPSFVEGGYTFDDPSNFQFINMIGAGLPLGLQFPPSGFKITLPASATLVDLDMGGFASSIKIDALNASGSVVTSASLTADNMIHTVGLAGTGITALAFQGGNNEGIIEQICSK